MNIQVTPEWWNRFFPPFRPLFNKISPQMNRKEIAFYTKQLNLKKDMSFLDCPVGIGRIAIPLAKKGIKITGVDITASYLMELEEKAGKLKLPIQLFHLDMRKIDFDNQFDIAANLWTSFGYFEKESDNILVLKKLFKAIKPGGKFVMQVINRDWIMKNFLSSGWEEVEGLKILEKREFLYDRSASVTEYSFLKDGKEVSLTSYIRMYSFHELKALFEKVGFQNIVGFGNIKEEPISRDRREMFIFADKPKQLGGMKC